MGTQNFAKQRAGKDAQTTARADILPAWTPPKTDWRKTDSFNLTPDYARIRGNLLHLQAWAARLYLPLALTDMRMYSVEDVPDASFFAAVDGNTDALLNSTFRPMGTGKARSYTANGPVWSEGDLNRIESAHTKLLDVFAAQENGRMTLKFTMGGGAFGACI